MMKYSDGSRLLSAALLCAILGMGLLASGCAVSSDVFRQGAVQFAYVSETQPAQGTAGTSLNVVVTPLRESRAEKRDSNALWLTVVPVGCIWSYWEQPGWLLWHEEVYAGYKPFGRDLAEVLAHELEKSRLFRAVNAAATPAAADLVLEGDVRDLTLTLRPHMLGTTIFIGQFLYALGLPVGMWEVTQTIDLRLVQAADGKVLWQKSFHAEARGPEAAYYGDDPMRCGYPSETLAAPMIREVVAAVDAEVQSRGEAYWAALAARRQTATAPVGPAQPPTPPPVPVAIPVSPPRLGNVHVLAIGAGSFEDKNIPSVKFAEADAAAVCKFFRESDRSPARPANVHLLTSKPNEDNLTATRGGIATAIESYLIRRATQPDDLVIIFYAGHGDADTEGHYYWVPINARRGSLASTGFPQAELERLLAMAPARNRLVIADACHSGALTGERNLSIRMAVHRYATIVSCQARETSTEWTDKGHGVFSLALVEGLEGMADSACGNGDDRVSFGELKKWLEQRVPRYAGKAAAGARQTPDVELPASWDNLDLTR